MTNTFMLGGGLYLLMLSKNYVSSGSTNAKGIIYCTIVLVFSYLFKTIYTNINTKLRMVENQMNNGDEFMPPAF